MIREPMEEQSEKEAVDSLKQINYQYTLGKPKSGGLISQRNQDIKGQRYDQIVEQNLVTDYSNKITIKNENEEIIEKTDELFDQIHIRVSHDKEAPATDRVLRQKR